VLEFAARSLDARLPCRPAPKWPMLVLFDHVTRAVLLVPSTHTVTKAKDRGWDKLTNGDLLAKLSVPVSITSDR